MIISKKRLGAIILLAASTTLGACMSTHSGVPLGYAVRGNAVLDPADIVHQDTQVAPRCIEWAEQTNPSPGKVAVANGWNGLLGGAVGGAAGSAASGAVLGSVSATSVLAGAAGYAPVAGILGAVNGYTYAEAAIHNDAKSCVIMDAAGLHLVPPSEGREIVESGRGRSYGRQDVSASAETASDEEVASTLLLP